jgi:hypothetical protein
MTKYILIAFTLISFKAHALFLFEPQVGYGAGTFYNNNTRSDGVFRAYSFGAKLAYADELWLLGLDTRVMDQRYDTGYVDDRGDEYLAMDIGWITGIHLGTTRIWYSFGTTGMQMEDGSDGFYYGNYDKWGFSWRYMQNIFLNLEIIRQNYDEFEISNQATQDLSGELENRTILISVSFPFIF